ncbi:MAG: hypothetical protein RSE09_03970 [Oscillospiraceae bacterium]
MHKALCALMIPLLLLTACGKQSEEQEAESLALQIRTELIAMTACTLTADTTADYGQRVYDFTLNVSYDSTAGSTITVVKPEAVAGVTVKIAAGSTTLEYDGVSLETGQLVSNGLSPLDALPAFLVYAREGFMDACGYETRDGQNLLSVRYRDPETEPGQGIEGALWFDVATHQPVCAELYDKEKLVISCKFSVFEKE